MDADAETISLLECRLLGLADASTGQGDGELLNKAQVICGVTGEDDGTGQ